MKKILFILIVCIAVSCKQRHKNQQDAVDTATKATTEATPGSTTPAGGGDSTLVSAETMCAAFKHGKFKGLLDDAPGDTFYLERKGTKQIERSLKTKGEIVSKVEWTGPCTYTLTFLSTTDEKAKAIKGETVSVVITGISNDTCYIATQPGPKLPLAFPGWLVRYE